MQRTYWCCLHCAKRAAPLTPSAAAASEFRLEPRRGKQVRFNRNAACLHSQEQPVELAMCSLASCALGYGDVSIQTVKPVDPHPADIKKALGSRGRKGLNKAQFAFLGLPNFERSLRTRCALDASPLPSSPQGRGRSKQHLTAQRHLSKEKTCKTERAKQRSNVVGFAWACSDETFQAVL